MFLTQGYRLNELLAQTGLAKSSFYYKPSSGKRGRKCTFETLDKAGNRYANAHVVNQIDWLLNQEFIDYGYKKVTAWLNKHQGYCINEKKVYRLMKANKMLNNRLKRHRQGKRRVTAFQPVPVKPFEQMQTDLKFIHIHGENHNALLATILDVFSRAALGFRFAKRINKKTIRDLMEEVRLDYQLPEQVYLRTDNGSQFEAQLFREYLASKGITHEFTYNATPEQNAFIEAFHSIVQNAVCEKYEFETFNEAKNKLNEFINFYNHERLHGALGNESPNNFLRNREKPQSLRLFPCSEFEKVGHFKIK
jgi:transposase InsO family protein